MINKDEFNTLANKAITSIIDIIEETDELGAIQVDIEGDIIYITIPTAQQYVLNKHTNYQEIWLVSPLSGPYHFAYDIGNDLWINKNGVELFALLEEELSQFIDNILSFK